MSDNTPICASCGSKKEVQFYTVDLDIKPVPFCLMCWVQIIDGAATALRAALEVTDE